MPRISPFVNWDSRGTEAQRSHQIPSSGRLSTVEFRKKNEANARLKALLKHRITLRKTPSRASKFPWKLKKTISFLRYIQAVVNKIISTIASESWDEHEALIINLPRVDHFARQQSRRRRR